MKLAVQNRGSIDNLVKAAYTCCKKKYPSSIYNNEFMRNRRVLLGVGIMPIKSKDTDNGFVSTNLSRQRS